METLILLLAGIAIGLVPGAIGGGLAVAYIFIYAIQDKGLDWDKSQDKWIYRNP